MKDATCNLKKPSDMLTALNSQQLLDVMQITNANFPIGTFSHSFGIETYIRNDVIVDGPTLKKVMEFYIHEYFLHTDMLGLRAAYIALNNNDFDRIIELDQIIHAQGMSKETRDAARRIGTQMLSIYMKMFPEAELLKKYDEAIKAKKCTGVPPISFAILSHEMKIDLETALYVHLYGANAALVQNCVRAIPLGQVEGQKITLELKREYFDYIVNLSMKLDIDTNLCRNNPGFEIAQMEHETVPVRLFMS